jgi:hypothetical protein
MKCYEQLMQNIGGLRSAAETQFTLLAQAESQNGTTNGGMRAQSTHSSIHSEQGVSPLFSPFPSPGERRSSILASIDELPESSADVSDEENGKPINSSRNLPQEFHSNLTPADMFSVFIAQLGPPMVR